MLSHARCIFVKGFCKILTQTTATCCRRHDHVGGFLNSGNPHHVDFSVEEWQCKQLDGLPFSDKAGIDR